MNTMLIILSVTAGLVAGAVVVLAIIRQLAIQHAASNDDAVSAAVQAALVEHQKTAEVLERDREATVSAAVTRATEMADAKLDARLRQGTEQLSAGASAFEKRTEDLSKEMRRMQKMVAELQEKSAGQHGAVVAQLAEAAKATTQLQRTAGGLREALASSKSRGQWGERMAEDVLRAAGMIEGLNYRRQKGVASGGIPDITFMMPRKMVLHMDVKFPIDNYLRYLDETEVGGAKIDHYRKQFVVDARARVKELADRRYHEAADSVESVVLFIPNDSVFSFVQECAPSLMDEAMASKIVLCGPATLFAVLAVIRQAMDNFMLERRSDEIMACLAQFTTEWDKFSSEVERHGKHLATAQRSFDSMSGTRTNTLQRSINRIGELQSSRIEGAEAANGEIVADPADPADPSIATVTEWPQLRRVVGE